ncbi:UDP-N-acetylmuramate--L-alanine ligase [Aeromicrobium sp. Leaf350]|uniref:UDP-N-acetylmuramate--L-alanine ligase n=1 Tax=Aeromicrobium sp. Leaf350 TaxID=2876565 RepID=UPI001E2BA9A0|nr:UDP-N-acetylmuramate--L-alanine ligase [Aeromicrobium sp. Leaf350]
MRVPVPEVIEPASALRHVHLVGIGGAGLSAIARLLRQHGVEVSGSDQARSAITRALSEEGITVHLGHRAENVAGADTVVVSTAVREDNPEVVAAREAGVRLWPRSAGLASLMAGRRTTAVAGTHGKTTTTAMLTCALLEAGVDPSFAIGAEVARLGTNARLGGGHDLVVEADESDGAFLVYRPAGAIVTNVDADHLDVWGTPEAYAGAFEEFVGTVGEFLVLDVDDEGSAALVATGTARGLDVLTCGFGDPAADWHGSDLQISAAGTRFTATGPGGARVEVVLGVVGAHYARDALLALATSHRLGADLLASAAGLATYTGAARRMQLLGEAGGVRVYDSYAHHPTEIAADLAAARAVAGDDRLVVAYQPHLVSRTRIFGRAMGAALSSADRVVVADLYLAREDPDPAVTSALVVSAVVGTPASEGGPIDTLDTVLVDLVRPGDVLLTLGAGDITTVGPRVLERLGAAPTGG